ncbi:hypothetical protein GCM10027090_05180 [Sinomonas soli]
MNNPTTPEEHVTKAAVPDDWTEPPWLTPFNRWELMWLCQRLDAANRDLRIVNRRLTEQLTDREEIPQPCPPATSCQTPPQKAPQSGPSSPAAGERPAPGPPARGNQ